MQVQPFYREKEKNLRDENYFHSIWFQIEQRVHLHVVDKVHCFLIYLNRFTHELGIVGRATRNESQTLLGRCWQIRQARQKLHSVRRFRGRLIGGEFRSARSRGSCSNE
jgi:hypothetical protein